MKQLITLKKWIFMGIGIFVAHFSFSQGSTTSAIRGNIATSSKEPSIGATVRIINDATGAKYGTTTDANGGFKFFNLEVGGPYRAIVTSIGFKEKTESNIYLKLGESYRLNLILTEDSQTLNEVVIVANKEDGGKSSAVGTNIDNLTINKLPSVNRDLTDFTRLDPRASLRLDKEGNSVSFAGINNRYNAIFIDGAVNNDLFGLTQSGTNGGQIGISPISPDAIKEIQIAIAPYDVTLGGFAGGSINAVTRTGTNKLEGSAYYFMRNESLAGKTPTNDNSAVRTKLPDFSAQTFGFRLGGAFIKNKLFYFINTEFQQDATPYVLPYYNGNSSLSTLDAISAKLKNDYGYDPGSYKENTYRIKGQKIIAKINWNINEKHQLSFRHSYVEGEATGRLSSDPSNVIFSNTGVIFPSVTNSSALELTSRFGNNKSNKLILGYTSVDDNGGITGAPFPNIVINDGGANITLGSDPFAFSNHVQQKVFSLTDNFTISKEKHTFTFGTHNEFYKIDNIFLPLHPAQYSYSSVAKFMANEAYLYLYGHTVGNKEIGDDAKSAAAIFNAAQLAFYGQDEYQVSNKFKIMGGLRFDIPIFEDHTPQINTSFNSVTTQKITAAGYNLEGAQASKLPATQIMISPRIGFEYDLDNNHRSKLSGGIGVFTSRVPFVWPAGIYLRNGLASGFDVRFNQNGFGPVGSGGIPFVADVRNQPFTDVNPSGDVDIFAKNFKLPQVLKTSITYEKKFLSGLFGMLSLQYTKTLNNLLVQNVNIAKNPTGTLTGTPDNRPIFSGTPIDPTYNYISLMSNTSLGHTISVSTQLQKRFANGFMTSLSYNFTEAMSVYDGNDFINSDNWKKFNSITGRNNAKESQISAFSSGHRVIGFVTYDKKIKHVGTSISLFYNGQTGSRFSYVYNDNGKLNNDNPNGNEARNLIYIPKSASDINLVDKDFNGDGKIETAADQWTALNSFIQNDPYLSKNRGSYAQRNAATTPFENILDLRFELTFFTENANKQKHELKLTFNMFNFTNFLNNQWGRRYFVGDANYRAIKFEGFKSDNTTPLFSFKAPNSTTPWVVNDSGINSARWQAQIGLRYSF